MNAPAHKLTTANFRMVRRMSGIWRQASFELPSRLLCTEER